MARIDKKFVLSTSQLNSHKFRCMTDGADLTDFIANPIMYWMHQGPAGKSADELMPIGFWEDIKKEGDEITAYPNINDADPFALKIGKMVEHGTVRAASIEAEPLEIDADKKNWLPGQKLPTLTRFRIGEASIVDRGSNKGALVKLKHNGKTVQLSDQASADQFFISIQQPEVDNMKITLNAKTSKALKLSEGTEIDAAEVADKLVELLEEKEAKVVALTAETVQLKDAAHTEKITLLVDKAVADRKILGGEKDKFLKLAKADFETTKELLDGKTALSSVESQLKTNTNAEATEVAELVKLNWDELFMDGKLERLKELDPETAKLRYKQKFGTEPKADFIKVKV